jgi:phosphopantothenoylcysteine decarboxylase/phosphopantothenate--cysteine ligase
MPEPEAILARVGPAARGTGALRGRAVPRHRRAHAEAIDPVRYISNHSSGRMGVAIAAAAWRRGAEVSLIAGPLQVPTPQACA